MGFHVTKSDSVKPTRVWAECGGAAPSVITSLSISFKQVPSIAVPAFLDSVLSSTGVSPSTLFESLIKELPFRAENTINGDKKFTYDDCNHIASLVAGAERKSDGEALIDTQHEPSFDNRFEDTIDKNLEALIGSWAHKDHHESFAISTATPTRRKICVVQSDEYEVYINEDGNAQALDVRIINVSKEDIEAKLEMVDNALIGRALALCVNLSNQHLLEKHLEHIYSMLVLSKCSLVKALR
ncbi:hypothetical protein DY000_02040830 [Brassica cretica]|uniref:Uncharacterized protein n=1 Tax=Brassica cretica TaxID=69181 RepID=A0ABQ7BIQ4_BRACR|nr:hypothetical protein DY000_02040830 [Brassica cretica]